MHKVTIHVTLICLLLALLLPGCPSTTPTELAGRVQVVNAISSDQNLDVALDGRPQHIAGLPFGQASGYKTIDAGIHTLAFSTTGLDVWLNQDLTIDADSAYTIVAHGAADNRNILVLRDVQEPHPTQARVRFLHAAVDVPPVSVVTNIGPADYRIPGMQNISYGSVSVSASSGSSFLLIPEGTYTLRFTSTVDSTEVATLPQTTFTAGKIYTLWIGGRQATDEVQAFLLSHN